MTQFNYLIPLIYDAPDSYDVTVAFPPDSLASRLVKRIGEVTWDIRVYHDGKLIEQEHRNLLFTPDRIPTDIELIYLWRGTKFDGHGRPAFIESSFSVANERGHFTTKNPVNNYALYSSPGLPSYRADGDYKFGSPPVIGTVRDLGRVLDGYPVVRLDRNMRFGESLAAINPYGRPINIAVRTHDGRDLQRQRVAPLSAVLVSLEPLLKPDEGRWTGRIQITANNRVLLYHIRHEFGNPRNITDHEHLDSYRADATHLPATQWLRQRIGDVLHKRFGYKWD
jgi:hypothetical protein